MNTAYNINILRKKVERIPNLPTLPAVVGTILELLENPNTTAKQVNQALTQDQAISAKILKLSNSAFYGFSRKVSTITEAVVLLGFNTVSSLAVSASVFASFFGKEMEPFNLEKFWKHSIGTAAIAKQIAKKLKYQNLESAFLSGVIHDIGKTILVQYFKEEFLLGLKIAEDEHLPMWRSEIKSFGASHADVGSWICEHWKFPNTLVDVVAYHHNITAYTGNNILPYIVSYANWVCQLLEIGSSGNQVIEPPAEIVFSKLNLPHEINEEMEEEIKKELENSKIFFAIAES